MKENYGNLETLKELGKNKKNSFTIEQLLDGKLKNVGGESRIEVTERMEKAFNKVLNENFTKKIAIVSHGASIKFLLMKWCNLNNSNQLEYNNQAVILDSPSVLKLIFEDKNLIQLEKIL